MSERTFRAVVAAVLVGALALAAVVVTIVYLPRSPAPSPGPTATVTGAPTIAPDVTPTAAPTPSPTPGPAFGEVAVSSVGEVARGRSSAALTLRLVEAGPDAIPDGPGSLTVTLLDAAGAAGTLSFAGSPLVDAPGSLGVSVELAGRGVLRVSILAADRFNIEPITVTGLAIAAEEGAALGPITMGLGGFAGSLAGGVAGAVPLSPGTVVAGP